MRSGIASKCFQRLVNDNIKLYIYSGKKSVCTLKIRTTGVRWTR